MTDETYTQLERLVRRAAHTHEVAQTICLAPCRMCSAVEGERCRDQGRGRLTRSRVVHADRLRLYRRARHWQEQHGLVPSQDTVATIAAMGWAHGPARRTT